MDPDVMVTILFVAYAVVAAVAIGGLLLSQNKRGSGADDDPSNPAG
jgi:preprotein translocase subunit SecG